MGGISLRPRVRRYRLGDSVLANDRERTKPSCVTSPDWVAGPIQSRDRLKVLKTRLLAFGENRRVDPLEEWHSRPKILRRKVGNVKKLRPISEDIFGLPTEDNPHRSS